MNSTYSSFTEKELTLDEIKKAMKLMCNSGMDNIFNHKIPIYRSNLFPKGMAIITDSEDTMIKIININNRKTIFRLWGFELSYEKVNK